MSGIVGLVGGMPRERAQAELERMVAVIRTDSFYETGMWIDESMGVYIGWSALKGSFADPMPLRNERGDVVLVFAGEEYPEAGTASRLMERGHHFDSEGPAYLVHLYEEDPLFPAGLNGRFQGIVIDRNAGTATLFNDRYGMHRLYYHESKEACYFAAEAKAILAVRPELRSIDPRGLGEFISCGCVLENRTLFAGVRVLPGGAKWTFRNCGLDRKGTYFVPQEWEDQSPLQLEDYYQALKEVFTRNLPRYFAGRQRIAMSLTGGLDTRLIMAWHKSPPGTMPCYTYGGPFRDCHDVVVARQVAQACQQPYQVLQIDKQFLSRFSSYAERVVYLTDGCADVSHAPDLYVSERAREIAPVRMTGLYGSEVLRRVRAFKPIDPLPGLLDPELLGHVRAAEETYVGALRTHPLSFAVFRQAPWHHYGPLAVEQTQLSVRSPYLDNDVVRTVFRAPEAAFTHGDVSLRLIADGDSTLRHIQTDRGLGGARGALAAAACRCLLEFSFKAEYGYDYGMPQWLARIDHFFSRLRLERLFLGRHKIFHFRIWYRDELSAYVREILLDPRTLSRPYLEPKTVVAIVSGHLKGNRNYTTAIDKLLTLELVHRLFVDQ